MCLYLFWLLILKLSILVQKQTRISDLRLRQGPAAGAAFLDYLHLEREGFPWKKVEASQEGKQLKSSAIVNGPVAHEWGAFG